VEELFDWILFIFDLDKCMIKGGCHYYIILLFYTDKLNNQNIFISSCKQGGKSIILYIFVLVKGTRKIMY
jgi:hypothetical protein